MADGFIVRRGGTVGTKAPTINFVSKTDTTIVFTLTNNDTATADVFWEVADPTPDQNVISLAGGATSSNQTLSGLDDDTNFTIFAFANAENKAGSDTVSLTVKTDVTPPTFISATGGTTTTYEDSGTFYKSHTFNSSGDFVVNSLSNQGSTFDQVDYLIIAGGASGAGWFHGGGGGAGGYRTTLGTSGANSSAESKVTVTAQTYGITIGAGGAGVDTSTRGNNGNNTTAFNLTSIGGGSGGVTESPKNGVNGGSGGGASRTGSSVGQGTAGQGTNGGLGSTNSGGGGGGAGVIGSNASGNNGGNGGNGLSNTLRTGSSETRAGGGGGAGNANGGNGGTGGGGAGGSDSVAATLASVNTGSGGGAANTLISGIDTSGAGGSGIVIIRYEVGAL